MLLQVINTFTMVLVPRISFYFKKGLKEEFNQLVSKALKLIIICAVPMIVGIQFTADFLLIKLYGELYRTSATILRMFSILLLISPVGYLLGSRMLLATNHENKMIISVGIGAVVNITGNAILIPIYAEFGATIASIISEIVVMIVYVILGKRYFKLQGTLYTSIKVCCAATIMAVFLFFCGSLTINGWLVLSIKVVGAILIYGCTLLLLKEDIVKQYAGIIINKLPVSFDLH